MVIARGAGELEPEPDNGCLLIEDCFPPLHNSPSKRISPAKRKQYYINQAIRNSDLTPKAKGKKSLRRLENTHYLMNLVEKDECCKDEEGEQTTSASPTIFTEACTNYDYIEIWNEFMNRSGEEQEKFLLYLEEEAKKKSKGKVHSNPQDERGDHLANSAKESFQRIDRRLRAALRGRHIPMGTLEFLEEELTGFFATNPQSVYKAMLENSYERLLLHALCQYLDLFSQSSDLNGKRQTNITNKRTNFLPPVPMLSAYLEQRR
ncbi:R3H domain-containing protein 4 [Callorhinchus milii]|uniref:R3H domain-containing protein C19orf22-like protein n=1 Tax=Callorhinchus milii TaxID=7868 RepID=V9L0S2_CALMI|nr:R3H domain-containing protein 4 [Callorhinchus milii]